MKSVLNNIIVIVFTALMFTACAPKVNIQASSFNDSEEKFPGLVGSAMMDYFGEKYEPPAEYEGYLRKNEVSFDDVKKALVEEKSIIPFEGEVGGTFFIVDDRLKQVGDQWIYADVDDGHVGLELLIKFEIDKKKSINFTVAATAYNGTATELYAVPEKEK